MKIKTAGKLRRIDTSTISDLLAAVLEEWRGLEFDRDGEVVNPLTGAPTASLVLLDGRHREAGARYRTTVQNNASLLPEEQLAEFETESAELTPRNADRAAWGDDDVRRAKANVDLSRDVVLTLREDTRRRLAFGLSDDTEHWAAEVAIAHGRYPTIQVSGTVDITALLEAEQTPGCLARVLGGTAVGSATIDLATAERDGRLLVVEGQANRFSGNAVVDVKTSKTTWKIAAKCVLRARGLARPILWFGARRFRPQIAEALAEFWASAELEFRTAEEEMAQFRADLAEHGGAAHFVRSALWDEDFDSSFDVD